MPLSLAECTHDGTVGFKIANHPTSAKVEKSERDKYEQLTATNTLKIAELQDRLYADSREGVVILIQAMDAAGKDSAIKHVIPADQMARLASCRDSLCGKEG